MRRAFIALLAAVIAALPTLDANAQPSARQAAARSSLSGLVVDSLSSRALSAARVELLNADSVANPARIAISDSIGRFRFDSVPVGRYLIGLDHPLLDSLGIERATRRVTVDGRIAAVRVDLAIPSSRTLRASLCGAAAVADSQALIIGTVRDARTRAPVESATVAVSWRSLAFGSGGMSRRTERRDTTSRETGWFALCGAPAGGTVVVSANHDGDSTEALELELPASGFLRRDLYVGNSIVVAADSSVAPRPADSTVAPAPMRRSGAGRVTGSVVAADGGRPVSGATVTMRNGPTARTDDRGQFVLSGVPLGTRMLDVRALTFAPLQTMIDVVDGAAPVRLTLVSAKALLDTVNVRADLVGDRDMQGFERRRRHGGAGRFITEEDIVKRNAVQAMDILRTMPGIMFARDSAQYDILVQRSMTSFSNPFCRVAVFVNGFALRDPNVNDLNSILVPKQLRGIEIYQGGATPPEYSRRNGCGSVVIWTR